MGRWYFVLIQDSAVSGWVKELHFVEGGKGLGKYVLDTYCGRLITKQSHR